MKIRRWKGMLPQDAGKTLTLIRYQKVTLMSILVFKKFLPLVGTPVVSYSWLVLLALVIVTPLKANAAAWCELNPGSQDIFDYSGGVIDHISGPTRMEIEQKIVREHPIIPGRPFILPDVRVAKYMIDLQGGNYHIVYQLLDGGKATNKYIDFSSCKSLQESG